MLGDQRRLIATGGDAYLSVWNMRKGKLDAMSDQQEDELLCMKLVKNGQKLVVGTESGTLNLYSWVRLHALMEFS